MEGNIAKSVKESWFGDGVHADSRLIGLEIPNVTESYFINELIAVAIAVGEEKLGKAILEEKIKNLQLRFFESYRNFLTIYSEAQLPEVIDKEAQKILKAFEEQEKALAELLLYFVDSDTKHIAQGLHILVSAFKQMSQANKNFQRYQLAMGGKECPDCGYINVPGEVYCKKCKHVFAMATEEISKEFDLMSTIDMEIEITTGGLLFPKHLANLQKNFLKMTKSDISMREFIGEVDWLLALLHRTKLKTEKVLFKETIGKAREGIIQIGWALMDGLNIVNISMNKIRLCLLTFDLGRMQEGWTELLYGSRKMMQGSQFYPLIDKQAQEDGARMDEEVRFFDEAES
ncbi:MAG: hypothetical protein RDV48_09780 [Candidatus Eremiobacteraeota bacterium]|nr:hypothetical protein [Candidatus Eremiobacteraeota bacterium]